VPSFFFYYLSRESIGIFAAFEENSDAVMTVENGSIRASLQTVALSREKG